MQYRNGIRTTMMVLAAASTALLATACQSGDDAGATKASSTRPESSASAANGPSLPPVASESAESDSPAKACAADALKVTLRQATQRSAGTGTGAVVVRFTNVSDKPCELKGHPTVAGAANGSPQHNSPLKTLTFGTATAVRVAPGGSAWAKLNFVQVQGEADGYCASGSDPVTYPTLVIGLPGSGSHQAALDDGEIAECDNQVTVTAVSKSELS
ncbi:DUF4232 domain-containing protein [Streptomyces adustus]|uniref:DUF4232 domain-containing protein n=1 Tax=Streptomyces adustus TaxID=1609272 RepID=A0A5N8VNZ7_9ACTN|nr:DUF4232 domain-containing protein [Streptomyces adustus]MPY35535.1 DUF4232 domain-containing protein [Streptomyces adustus]